VVCNNIHVAQKLKPSVNIFYLFLRQILSYADVMEELVFNVTFRISYMHLYRFIRRYRRVTVLSGLYNLLLSYTSLISARVQYQLRLRLIYLRTSELTLFADMDFLLRAVQTKLAGWLALGPIPNVDVVSVARADSYVVSYSLLLQTSGKCKSTKEITDSILHCISVYKCSGS
jgi:hypothetical protein